jgi:DNA polymerase
MIIHGDFETRSEVELKDVGLDVYARHPSTDVWCFAWAIDDGEPEIWFPGAPAPALAFPFSFKSTKFYAHNAQFELAIWNHIMVPRYGWPVLHPERVRCTMAMAYAMSLPGSLENASAALGLSEQKDMAGHRLMMQMSRPRGYDDAGNPIWWDDYDKQMQLHAYCKQDVRTEQALCKRLLPLSEQEQKLWVLDQKINNAGVYVDRTAVERAITVVKRETDRLNEELFKVTEGCVSSTTEVAA